MALQTDNYIETINGFTMTNWKPLLDLIPEIEKTFPFEKHKVLHKSNGTNTDQPDMEYSIISRFHRIVYALPIVIAFDWASWDEGRRMVNDEKFNFDSIDIPTKCKIITAIVRNDRYCEGALHSAFRSGLIHKILLSIENQLIANNEQPPFTQA